MYFTQFQHGETGCLSYAVGCLSTRELAIVDANKDVDAYIQLAQEIGSSITQVIDTHIHADHLSGGPDLARRTGAPYRLHESARAAIPFVPLEDKEMVQVGNAHVHVIHTPGHSPESVCLLVTDGARSDEPAFILTGDTVLIGDVGRPDLHVDACEGARDLHRSIHTRLLHLGDHLEVFPAHYGRSVCGAGLSPRTSSTLGYERRVNPLLKDVSADAFVSALVDRQIRRPDRYEEIVAANCGAA